MNTQTLHQRKAITAYNAAHREAIYHAERTAPAPPATPTHAASTPARDDEAEATRNARVDFIVAMLVIASVPAIYQFTMWLLPLMWRLP